MEKEVDGSFKWWSKAKRIAGVSTPKLSVPDLNADGRTATDKVKVFVDFFAKKCTEDATLPSAPHPPPEDYPHFDRLLFKK